MKKICRLPICLLLTILINQPVHARELGKGMTSIGGRASYFQLSETDNEDGSSSSTYSFGIGIGYLIRKNFELGSEFTYSNTSQDGSSSRKSYTIAPFVTKHIPLNSTANLTFTGQFIINKTERNSGNSSQEAWRVAMGWMHFFDRNIAADISLNHMETISSSGDYNDYEKNYFDIGLKIYF